MPKQAKPNPKSSGLSVGAIIVGALVLFTATFAYVKLTPDANRVPADELRSDRAVAGRSDSPGVKDRGETVSVSKPHYEGDDLKFTHERANVPSGKSGYLVAVNSFLDKSNIVDASAHAKSARLEGTVLVLDFQSGFERTYGAEDEQTLINGLIDTARQFKGVTAVRILVNGKRLETLGNVDLTEDLCLN